ncbi:MAG: hypothetical protein AMK69_11650 [Nitrospira bacterium SG8_3]|nr:MAG: hypothetical protein AMK69_11650 [Nitrospira bacterium SG8_3]MDH4193758.1 hypothetical protein [Nitrospirota bacterium]MDH4359554.1 hypothetical protein [Nitrospirota bacterium]MDH5296176.1 hypothetical protein [Nitrospirota bacterium]MDH5574862.1 hypothetical protein [Nitrospirota bacterium]
MDHTKKPEAPKESKAGTKDSKAEAPKIKKELSVMTLPHDNDVMAQEMAELFDEDRVTHQHGNAEPEKD